MFFTFRPFFFTTIFICSLTVTQQTQPLLQNFTASLFGETAALFVDGTQGKMFSDFPYFCFDAVRIGSSMFGVTLPMICTGAKLLYALSIKGDTAELPREIAFIVAFLLTKSVVLRQSS